MREGRVELPRPFGHRILRLHQPGTDPGSRCRPVSSGVVRCHPVSFRREQAVSENGAVACTHAYVERCPRITRGGGWHRHEERRRAHLATSRLVLDGGLTRPGVGRRPSTLPPGPADATIGSAFSPVRRRARSPRRRRPRSGRRERPSSPARARGSPPRRPSGRWRSRRASGRGSGRGSASRRRSGRGRR